MKSAPALPDFLSEVEGKVSDGAIAATVWGLSVVAAGEWGVPGATALAVDEGWSHSLGADTGEWVVSALGGKGAGP